MQAMTQLISESHDIISALGTSVEAICKTTNWEIGEVWMPSADRKYLELISTYYTKSKILNKFVAWSKKFTFPPGIGLPGRVWSSGKPVWIKNVTEDPNFPRSSLAAECRLKGALAIPITTRNKEVFAVMAFFTFRALGERDDEFIRVVSSAATHLEVIIQRKLVEHELSVTREEIEQKNFEMATIAEMGDNLQVINTTEEAYTAISKSIRLLIPNGAVFILSPSHNLLTIASSWGNVSVEEPVAPNDCYALRLGRQHLFIDAKTDIQCPCVGKNTNRYICTPLMGHGEMLGLLYLQFESFDTLINKDQIEARQRLAVNVSERIGLSLSILNFHNALKDMSIRDALTGLYNRRYMDESLEREIFRANRKKTPLGIIMLDIDHFKRFNDTFGHEAGDAILRELGALLRRNIRSSDIACRYGGEEFILILPDAILEMTQNRAEQLREMVKLIHIQWGNQSLGPATLSFGVAVFPDHGSTAEAVVKMADMALYRAKSEGRDRVCVAI